MLDLKQVRRNPRKVAAQLRRRGFEFDADTFIALDARRKRADVESQSLQAARKAASRKVGELVQAGVPVPEARQTVAETLGKIAADLDRSTADARQIQRELEELLLGVPNILASDVPDGTDESDNRELSRWGEVPSFAFEAKDHVDIGAGLGGIDFETAARITGSRFAILTGGVAGLHRALIQFMLDTHTREHGYREINVPYIVNADSLQGTGQLPKFEDDLFKLRHEADFYLIPTAEVPVTNVVRGHIVEAKELPAMKFVCHSPCFRREAGSHGKDTRGMIRQHQFEKVELVQMVRPDESDQALKQLTGHAQTILESLHLAYRKVILCAGDVGFGARRTYDLEVWLPAQNTYREISSCSSFGDYQARRMGARWRNPDTGKPELLHTLNGSGLAVGRTLVAVLENYQREDSSVAVPEVLRSYMGGLEVLEPR